MTTEPTTGKRVETVSRLRWVPIPQMKVSPKAQRDLQVDRVSYLAANFDPEKIGHPIVNQRDNWFYIIDGQHRVEMMKAIGWGDQAVQCWTYEDLTEAQEAEMFLGVNDVLAIKAMPKFTIGVEAGRAVETDIDRVVRAQGLMVSAADGGIGAVATLRKVYSRSGGAVLGRTLRIIRDAYGSSGLGADVIDGLGLLCQRYNGQIDDASAITKLGAMHGGVNGLRGKAATIRRQTLKPRNQCIAAAATEVLNSGKGGKKLPDWWKS